MCSAPAAFAEPTSNALVTLAVLFGVRSLLLSPRQADRGAVFNAAAYGALTLLAISVKRENFIVPAVLCGITTALLVAARGPSWPRLLRTCAVSVVVFGVATAFVWLKLDFGSTIASETGEYGQYPFSVGILIEMAPVFLRSFSHWECGTWAQGWLAIVGAWTLISRLRAAQLAVPLIFAAYLILYMSHVRSYYILNHGELTDADALRYSMNVMSLFSLMVGFGCCQIADVLPKWRTGQWPFYMNVVGAVVCLTALCIASYIHTYVLRAAASEDEWHVRVEPALAAAGLLGSEAVAHTDVITLEPLLLRDVRANKYKTLLALNCSTPRL